MWLKLMKTALESVNVNVVDFNGLNNGFSEVLIFKQENVLWWKLIDVMQGRYYQ